MVEYEVTIEVAEEILEDYLLWLQGHIRGMLELEGFNEAKFFHVKVEDKKVICVRYQVESIQLLEKYINETSKKMRVNLVAEFKDKYSITRRILSEGDI